jgi:hypothetical protein
LTLESFPKETFPIEPKRIVLLLNVGVVVVLACLLTWNWLALERWGSSRTEPTGVVFSPIERPEPVRLASLKNLFHLEKPPSPSKEETSPEQDEQTQMNTPTHTVRLDGIILSGAKKIAVLLLSPKTKKAKGQTGKPEMRKVMEGGELLSFVVRKIEIDRIILYCPKRNEEVKLVIFKENATED